MQNQNQKKDFIAQDANKYSVSLTWQEMPTGFVSNQPFAAVVDGYGDVYYAMLPTQAIDRRTIGNSFRQYRTYSRDEARKGIALCTARKFVGGSMVGMWNMVGGIEDVPSGESDPNRLCCPGLSRASCGLSLRRLASRCW